MSRPRLLDLACKAGGASVGYARAGFDVTGLDIEPQERYPYRFICGDMLDLDPAAIAREYSAVAASPPCQGYHSLGTGPHLIAETRSLLEATGLPYVIENIPEARWALHDPILICGTMFDPPLDGLKRHRLFEANWPLEPPVWPCRHKLAAPRFRVYEHGRWYMSPFVKVYGSGGGKAREHWPAAMQIDWMTDAELAQAIPPAYTAHVGAHLLEHLAQASHQRGATTKETRVSASS